VPPEFEEPGFVKTGQILLINQAANRYKCGPKEADAMPIDVGVLFRRSINENRYIRVRGGALYPACGAL
jgi:hypothetical protein